MLTSEKLANHTKQLDDLSIGDKVYIQNQTGPCPNKWDRSGLIVEKRDFDQYVIKVSGTGRLTVRNRRFLRKLDINGKKNSVLVPQYSSSMDLAQSTPNLSYSLVTDNSTDFQSSNEENPSHGKATPVTDEPIVPANDSMDIEKESDGNIVQDEILPSENLSQRKYPLRERRRKKVYEPETGKYV